MGKVKDEKAVTFYLPHEIWEYLAKEGMKEYRKPTTQARFILNKWVESIKEEENNNDTQA